MNLDQLIEFLLRFTPGIIVWGISYIILIRKFHSAISIVEIIVYTAVCESINSLLFDDSDILMWLIAVVVGIVVTLLIRFDVLLRFFRKIRLTQKTQEPDVFRILASDYKRNCYVHLKDGSIILGHISFYSDNNRGFYLTDAIYIMIKGELVDKDWYRSWSFNYPEVGFVDMDGIYFDDFSAINFIEFEKNI